MKLSNDGIGFRLITNRFMSIIKFPIQTTFATKQQPKLSQQMMKQIQINAFAWQYTPYKKIRCVVII